MIDNVQLVVYLFLIFLEADVDDVGSILLQ